MFGASDDYLDSFFSAAYFNHTGGHTKNDENRRNVMVMSTTAGRVTKMRPHSAKLERLEVLPGRPVSAARKVRPASASAMRAKTTTVPLHLPPMNDDYVGVADGEKVKRKKKKKKKSAMNNVLTQLDLPGFERISSQKTYRITEATSPETTFETTFIAENPGFLQGISMHENKNKPRADSPLHHLSYNDAFDDLLHCDGSEDEKVGYGSAEPRKSPKKSPVKKPLSFSSPTKKSIVSNSPSTRKSVKELKKRLSRSYSTVTVNTDDTPPNNCDSMSEEASRWIGLRNSYIEHLKKICTIEDAVALDEKEVADKKNMIFRLLPALRKVSAKIVSNYQKDPGPAVEDYLNLMASDMNWIHQEPYSSWIVIDPINNAFFIPFAIDGSLTCLYIDEIPKELVVSDAEIVEYKALGAVIWKIFSKKAENRQVDKRFVNVVNDENNAVGKMLAIYGQNQGLIESKRHDAAKGGIRFFFSEWKKVIKAEIKIRIMSESMIMRRKRMIFFALQKFSWKCFHFRRLQMNSLQNLMKSIFDGWKDYLLWCRRFNSLRRRADINTVKHYIHRLRRYSKEHHEVRSYRSRRKKAYLKVVFKGIFYNLVLSRFYLRNRLKRGTECNLFERTIVLKLFHLWKQYRVLSITFLGLNKICTSGHLSHAFRQWYILTWGPPQPPMTARQRLAKAGSQFIDLLSEIRRKGRDYLSRTGNEMYVSVRESLVRSSPTIRAILQSREIEQERREALHLQRLDVIRKNREKRRTLVTTSGELV